VLIAPRHILQVAEPLPSDLSKTERELLKCIWRLTRDAPEAHTVVMAEAIGASAATVTATIKRLASQGLVDHVPYHGAVLTTAGRRCALDALRRHRLVECFLTDLLGVDWTRVDPLAIEFEHQVPSEVANRLHLALGEPESCPHGFPIPPPGAEDLPVMARLGALRVGGTARIALSGSTDPAVVDFLRRIGLVPGAEVEVVENEPFAGRVVVRVEATMHGLSTAVAHEVLVRTDLAQPPSESTRAEVSA
jgi:DtxR family Mn-dependent transcriptional regulator